MDSFAAKIEALEHQAMRAWMQSDRSQLKRIAARDFMFLLGATEAAILDRASWLEASITRLRCQSYRFGDVYVRRHGRIALFGARLVLDGRLGQEALTGDFWLTDLWMRARVGRSWRLVERTLSRPVEDAALPGAVRQMQLWR